MQHDEPSNLPAWSDRAQLPAVSKCIAMRGAEFKIPPRTAELLFLSADDPATATSGLTISISVDLGAGQVTTTDLGPSEPSTIYLHLPVRRPTDVSQVPRPPYYPTYVGLTPEQRWVYLSWLTDVSQSINIGWVFIYYYGLERHLLSDKLDLAFDEILLLRHAHPHPSLLGYSTSALLSACIVRKRSDLLRILYQQEGVFKVDNAELRLLHHLGIDLSPRTLAEIGNHLPEVNRRYIRANRPLFELVLEDVLTRRYGRAQFPFGDRYQLDNVPRRPDLLFANISFPDHIRTPTLPNFLNYGPFTDEVKEVLRETHELVKNSLRSSRDTKSRRALPRPPTQNRVG